METAQDPAAYIYEGIWTDWSKGSSTWGLTLTLCPDNAVLVTSFLAVFVTLAGSQLWTIVRFTLHQTGTRTQREPSTPNHTKQQLILRNASTDLATARLMAYLAWGSRRGEAKLSARTVYLAIFAILHAILFMIAGTFSNLAISIGNPTNGTAVLSRSKHCGIINQTYEDIAGGGNNPESAETLELSVEYIVRGTRRIQLGVEYAQKCYLTQQSYNYMSSACNTMKKPRLGFETRRDGRCPFEPRLCHDNADVIVFETDQIDSHNDLGINASPNDRLNYKRVTTCAVLNGTNHIQGWNGSLQTANESITQQVAEAHFGPSLYKSGSPNWTYSYTNFASLYDDFTVQVTIPYQVDAEFAYAASEPAYSTSDFEPIAELAQTDADLTLFFLSYTGTYLDEIDDPWFAAHQPRSVDGAPPLMVKRFARDTAISTIGCTEKHQFCTNGGICTPFGGFDQVQNVQSFATALNSKQNATFDRMLRAVTTGSIKQVVEKLGVTDTPLLAIDAVAVGSTVVSLPLPNDQWQRELNFWHSVAMATVQRTIVEWSTGQIAPRPEYLLPPEESQDKWYCQNQMIPSTVFQSFSIMAMILILVFGTLIIAISLNVEAIARCIRRCSRRKAPLRDWDHDDMLKLPSSFRDSIWRPRLPPKDGSSPRLPTQSGKKCPPGTPDVPAIRLSTPTIRVVDNDSQTRSSSPTLPQEQCSPGLVVASAHTSPESNRLQPPSPSRNLRDSWMAISLNSVEAIAPVVPLQVLDAHGASHHVESEPNNPLQHSPEIQQAPMMQRFRSPMLFHVPRTPGGWV